MALVELAIVVLMVAGGVAMVPVVVAVAVVALFSPAIMQTIIII